MTTRFDTKDPEEGITAGFNFGAMGASVTSPTVDVAVHAGVDEAPEAIILGDPVIDGAWVYQRIQGGVPGVDYSLRCLADVGGDRLLIDAVLPVRERPAA